MALATSVIMPVAIFYEILWADLFPAGTYVPPNGTLPVFLVCCLVYMGLGVGSSNKVPSYMPSYMPSPSDLLLPLLLAMPAAECAARVETFLRRLCDTRHDALVHWLAPDTPTSSENPSLYMEESSGVASHHFPQGTVPTHLILTSLWQSFLVYLATFMICDLVLFVTFWCVETFIGHFPSHFALFDDHAQGSLTWPMLWFAALVGALLALRIKKAYIAYGATICVLFLSFFFLK